VHVGAAGGVGGVAGDRLDDPSGILVHHYGEAFALTRAAGAPAEDVEERLRRSLLMAGDRAAQLDTEAAERYFTRAVELAGDRPAERAAALGRLAPILSVRGQGAEAMKAYEAAIPVLLETDPVAAGVALMGLASTAWQRGETERARLAGLEAIEALTPHPGLELVRAYGSAALTEAIAGRYDEAQALLDPGFALAEEAGVEDVSALLHARASVRGYQGDGRCVDDVRMAVDIGIRLGHGRETAVSMNNLADAERMRAAVQKVCVEQPADIGGGDGTVGDALTEPPAFRPGDGLDLDEGLEPAHPACAVAHEAHVDAARRRLSRDGARDVFGADRQGRRIARDEDRVPRA